MVFPTIRHILYLCNCVFVYLHILFALIIFVFGLFVLSVCKAAVQLNLMGWWQVAGGNRALVSSLSLCWTLNNWTPLSEKANKFWQFPNILVQRYWPGSQNFAFTMWDWGFCWTLFHVGKIKCFGVYINFNTLGLKQARRCDSYLQSETINDWPTDSLTGVGARRCYRI